MVKAILIVARIKLTAPNGGLTPILVPGLLTHPTSSFASYRILLSLPHTAVHCITADLIYPAFCQTTSCFSSYEKYPSYFFTWLFQPSRLEINVPFSEDPFLICQVDIR